MTVKEELKSYIEQIPKIFTETGIDVAISKSHTQYIEYSLKSDKWPLKSIIDGDLLSLSMLLESFACDLYMNQALSEAGKLFEDAFVCRRDYMSVNSAYDDEPLFYLSVAALGAKRASELRLTLDEHDISFTSTEKEWPILVQTNIIKAFLLLCRKKNGWKDIEDAISLIKTLHKLQKEFEKKYLSQMTDMAVTFKITGVGRLVALYNLAKIIEIVGTYLITANPANPILKIKKHYDNAVEALERSGDYSLEHFSDMLFVGCDALINNSIWYNTQTLGEKARKLVQELADAGREKPFIELWPSQQEAMRSSLFDPAKHAVVLQMPTSAGKTLLAEFSIVQSFALNPDNTVVYVVPTRALVNQTTLQLRRDLSPLGLITEAAVPVFELDPTENELLRKKCHILVSTPEKIELLMRAKHPIVNAISLIVVDEVHNISNANRGSTLELFLGTVLREKAGVRFLVMSPFIPNGDEIGSWLGKDRNAQIRIDWKPSERITAVATYVGKKANKYIQLKTLLSAHNSDVKDEIDIPIQSIIVKGSKSKARVALSTAISMLDKGSVLLLCGGRESSVKQAKEAMIYLDDIKINDLIETTIDYVKDELGENHTLAAMLRKGIAFHHAGLSQESRYLIERLVERGDIKLICATTTLAQGVNFPIKTVIVDAITRATERMGHRPLPFDEFWNIAGRAGRAMKDHVGLIIFAARNQTDIDKYKDYLQQDARNVVSSILEDLDKLTEIADKFDRKFIGDYPALARFFQYLLHAITVGDYETVSTEIEDVLRSSLVYHQVGAMSSESAKKLIQLARAYLGAIKEQSGNKGILQLVDGTGFSSVTVNFLWSQRDEFKDINIWNNEVLFSPRDTSLSRMIEVLAGIPELDLTRIGRGVLGVEAIANIIKEWVAGVSIEQIADKYFAVKEDRDERVLDASRYIHNKLVAQLAWGMSALQQVSLFGQKDVKWDEVGHIPALMYYGVSSKEAATLRMLGVPRKSAEKLGRKYSKEVTKLPTFQKMRDWLNSLPEKEWEDVNKKSKLSGKEAKSVWQILNGIA